MNIGLWDQNQLLVVAWKKGQMVNETREIMLELGNGTAGDADSVWILKRALQLILYFPSPVPFSVRTTILEVKDEWNSTSSWFIGTFLV